jgi:hypothetical protein
VGVYVIHFQDRTKAAGEENSLFDFVYKNNIFYDIIYFIELYNLLNIFKSYEAWI